MLFQYLRNIFFSEPDTLKKAWNSTAIQENVTNLITDIKGNPGPEFLAASMIERTLQKSYFISYVSYISCPDKYILQSPKALQVIKLHLIT